MINASPTITDNVFSGNTAEDFGGAIYGKFTNLTIENNTFTGNSSEFGGGAIYLDDLSDGDIINNVISGNESLEGGGILVKACVPLIRDNVISSNSVIDFGGGILCFEADPVITNNLIINNSAGRWGGGMLLNFSFPDISNCTFNGNYADKKGGALCCYYSTPTITNSIFWDDIPNEFFLYGWPVEISYSDISGGQSGDGNINADPLFVQGPFGSYYLSQSAALPPDGVSAPLRSVNSPCVDTGNQMNGPGTRRIRFKTTRIDAVPDTGMIDMGYHYPIRVTQIPPGHYIGGEFGESTAGTETESSGYQADDKP